MLVGLGGNNGTTLTGGVIANREGITWKTKDGVHSPNYFGSLTQASTCRVGAVNGEEVHAPFKSLLPMVDPNDIVFDAQGGMWFTDLGKTYETYRDVGCIYYAKPDGSLISRQLGGRESPNGIGLSPDEKTLYFAETMVGRVWAYDITAPGQLDPRSGRLVVGLPGMQLFDSLAIDAEGNVCVATLVNGGITIVSPDGERVEHVATGDVFTTNICFGGEDLKTAYITLSGTGRLVSTDWPVAGLPLNFLNR